MFEVFCNTLNVIYETVLRQTWTPVEAQNFFTFWGEYISCSHSKGSMRAFKNWETATSIIDKFLAEDSEAILHYQMLSTDLRACKVIPSQSQTIQESS